MSKDLKAKVAALEAKRDAIKEEILKQNDLRAELRSVERDLVEHYNALLRSESAKADDAATAT